MTLVVELLNLLHQQEEAEPPVKATTEELSNLLNIIATLCKGSSANQILFEKDPLFWSWLEKNVMREIPKSQVMAEAGCRAVKYLCFHGDSAETINCYNISKLGSIGAPGAVVNSLENFLTNVEVTLEASYAIGNLAFGSNANRAHLESTY